MAKSRWLNLIVFVIVVSSISLFFHAAATAKSQIVLTVPARNAFSIGSNVVLTLLASLVPGGALLAWSRECRAALLRFTAGVRIYVLALLIGFVLPFVGYIGARHAYPVWNSDTPLVLIRVFLINLLLTPLWEEVIWRGYFYPKVSSMIGLPRAILVTAVGWTIWHIGFIFFLYRSGTAIPLLLVFAVQVFFAGVVLCSIFTLGGNSLAPCVLLHCSFDASTSAYLRSYGRVADLGSYIAEAFAILLVSAILFRHVMRRAEVLDISGQSHCLSAEEERQNCEEQGNAFLP